MADWRKPGGRELFRRLTEAIQAFEHGFYGAADDEEHRHLEADMAALSLECIADYWDLVYECLQLARENPLACYRQPVPPKSTRHKSTRNLPMWAFEVSHPCYPFLLYFKFCLKKTADGVFYLHIDCHESRKK